MSNNTSQSSLLKYWEFKPELPDSKNDNESGSSRHARREATSDTQSSSKTNVERASTEQPAKSRWGFRSLRKHKATTGTTVRESQSKHEPLTNEKGKEKEKEKVVKKMPASPPFVVLNALAHAITFHKS